MEKLNVEQKAKAYDELIKRLKDFQSEYKFKTIEKYFPELKESEDEKMRKELIMAFKSLNQIKNWNGIERTKILVWLEKQGEPTDINPSEFDLRLNKLLKQFETLSKEELTNSLSFYLNVVQNDGTYRKEKQGKQKPVVIIPKFRVGDEIKTANEEPLTITEITDSGYWSEDLFICSFEDSAKWELVEQKSANNVEPKFHKGEWITNGDYTWKIIEVKPLDYILQSQDGNIVDDTISHVDKQFHSFTTEDAKDGDVLVDGNLPFIFKKVDTNKHSYAYCGISVDDGFKIVSDGEFGEWTWMQDIKPATKEQRDALEKAMADAGYTFDFEKRKLKILGQSEVTKTSDQVPAPDCRDEDDENTLERLNKWITFLKSIKERYTWKPSVEQLEALESATENCAYSEYQDCLKELIKQLKQL